MWTCASIAVGFIIDLIVGDPHGIPHPVVGIGRLIAAKTGRELIDTDAVIVEREGEISRIFAEKGEEYFRNLETALRIVF